MLLRARKTCKGGWGSCARCCRHEIAWLKVALYASTKSCLLVWKRLLGERSEEVISGDDDVPNTDSLEILVQRKTGWAQENSAVDPMVVSVWESSKKELTLAQITIPTTCRTRGEGYLFIHL